MPEWWKEQIGPLPAGLWLAAGGAGIGLAYLANRKKSGSSSADAGLLTTGLPGSGAITLPTGTPSSTMPDGSSSGNPIAFTDNTQWANAAIRELIAAGYDPILVQSTIGDYLAGKQLSATETATWAIILTRIGPPPFLVPLKPGPSPTPTETTTPTPSPTNTTPAPSQWVPPLYPDTRAGPPPPGDVCPSGHAKIMLPDGSWSCMLWTQYAAGYAPAGTVVV